MVHHKYNRYVLFICLLNMHCKWPTASGVDLPADIQYWCPYTKFCNMDPKSTDIPNVEPGKKITPCCETCTCSENCGLRRNCCTDELDHYKKDNISNAVCKQLITKRVDGPFIDDHYFYIVDKCPNASESCNERKVAPWGSFHPTYSRNSHLIYYNSWCAKCHHQTDTIPLDAVIRSASDEESYSSFVTGVLFDKTNDMNHVVRFTSSREANLQAQICYPNVIRHCIHDSVYAKTMSEPCRSFNATYRHGAQTYANVYCYICSFKDEPLDKVVDTVREADFCDISLSPAYNPRSVSPLTFLFSTKTAQLLDDASDDILDEKGMIWCEEKDSGIKNCRRIYCPEGQFHLRGKCDYIGDAWLTKSLSFLIKLTPKAKIPVDHVTDMRSNPVTSQEILRRPIPFNNFHLRLLYKASECGCIVDHFVAHLQKETPFRFDPNLLMNSVRESIRKLWYITLGNNSYAAHAQLDSNLKYLPYQKDGAFIPFWLDILRFHQSADKTAIMVNESQQLREMFPGVIQMGIGHLIVTKMFFCEQVELLPHEYTTERVNVYLKSRAIYMGHGSFVKVIIGNHTGYRVCLSDLLNAGSNIYRGFVIQSFLAIIIFY